MRTSKFIYLIIFLWSLNIFAQNKTDIAGKIIYKFTENKRDSTKKQEELNKVLDLLVQNSKGLTFNLIFKNDVSLFYVDDALEKDAKPMGIHFTRNLVGKGHFYTNLKKKSIVRDYEAFGEKFLITSKTKSFSDWKLTKETKMIGKYKCYKATTLKTVTNPLKTSTFEIVAWYTPQIPVKFGIKEYNNLPGLILELKDTHYTIYAHKISFVKIDEIEIKPFEGKTITEEQFQKKANEIGGMIILDNKN